MPEKLRKCLFGRSWCRSRHRSDDCGQHAATPNWRTLHVVFFYAFLKPTPWGKKIAKRFVSFSCFKIDLDFQSTKKSWVSEWNLWGKHCEMCVSWGHSRTAWKGSGAEIGINGDLWVKKWSKFWWYRRWIEVLNQIEPSWKNQAEPDSFDHVWSYLTYSLSHFAPGEVDSWREWQRILLLRLHEMPGVFQTSNPYEALKEWKEWRDHIRQMISNKKASILHCFIRFWCCSLSLHPWLHVAVLLPWPFLFLRLVHFTSISGPSP